MSDGYIIELAFGHFIPKGVVSISRYILDAGGNLLDSHEVYQLKRFRILNGYVVEEDIDLQYMRVSVSKENLIRIVEVFHSFLDTEQTSVEFGVLESDQEKKF